MNIKFSFIPALFACAGLLFSLSSCSEDLEMETVSGLRPEMEGKTSANEPFQTNGEVVFFCDFQNIEVSNSLFTMHDLSGQQLAKNASSVGFSKEKPWLLKLMDELVSTNFYAGSHSWFEPAGKANSWLVTTRIDIPAEGYTLQWKSESGYTELLDCLRIFISTQGDDPVKDFPETPVWESLEEPAGETSGILDGEWNDHSLSLDEYAGKSVWIAFVNQSDQKGILCIDDVKVVYSAPFELTNLTERITTDETVKVKGLLKAKEIAIDAFDVHYTTGDSVVRTIHYEDVNLQPGNSMEFTFDDPMPLTQKGSFQDFKVWMDVPGFNKVGFTDSVAVAALVPVQRAVVEEGTGTWCGNCPLGMLAIEHLHETFGDQVIAIAVHNDDAMTVDYYDRALGFNAYPMGTVNRHRYTYPASTTGNNYSFDGDNTFLHDVREILNGTAIWEPLITKAQLSDGTIEVESETRFALNLEAKEFCIAYVLTENDVTPEATVQSNYFYNYTHEFFGDFGKGGKYGKKYLTDFAFQEVARGIYPAFRGHLSGFPSVIEAGKAYPHSFSIDLSETTIEDETELYLTMLLIDNADGCILNAHQVKVESIDSGIHDITM